MIKSIFLSLSLLLIIFTACAQHIIILQQGKPATIRGLSVVDNKIAWISGSKGYIALTIDGGKNWAWQQVKGFEQADFRDIEAFSAKEAIIMSSGTPALVLKTINGGKSWQVKYRNTDTAYFLDAMDFNGKKHGFILGDPINNKFVLLETMNGGETWRPFKNRPDAMPGEAAFAASGTCLRSNGNIFIATGGQSAEVAVYTPGGTWVHHYLPVLHGQSAQGAFSVAINGNKLLVVGGDYQHDKRSDSTTCYSGNNGLTWQSPITPPSGYQSCVEYIAGDTYLSTGTPGTNITTDGGKTWVKIDDQSFNVCRKAKYGTLVLLAGNGGKIGILTP
jgi:photosystem II stability/assembly factor-like uncharacterized protein